MEIYNVKSKGFSQILKFAKARKCVKYNPQLKLEAIHIHIINYIERKISAIRVIRGKHLNFF
jgi:hypothetical protein